MAYHGSKHQIETLSIAITDNEEINYKLNFQKRICNLKTTLNSWKKYNSK